MQDDEYDHITSERYAELCNEDERGLVCNKCGCRHFRTTHTEPLPTGMIRRRKECRHCGERKVTFERDRP